VAFWDASHEWWHMSLPRAPLSRLLTWSCVDGPGNRMVLFLQGCNFACAACHNPHTIGLCNDCGACISACEPGALRLVAGRMQFDTERCTRCDACLDACPISANPMVRPVTVPDVLRALRENRDFLNGLTLSGGEATLHAEFVRALFAAVRADPALAGLSCFLDSNGHLGPAAWERLLPLTDGVMLDIKAFDPYLHQYLTGRDNARVLASARRLHAAGKLHELRFLLIPGQTDTGAEIAALISFVKKLGHGLRIRLNAFRRHGVRGAAADWPPMPREGVEAVAEQLTAAGLGPVSVPAVWV